MIVFHCLCVILNALPASGHYLGAYVCLDSLNVGAITELLLLLFVFAF